MDSSVTLRRGEWSTSVDSTSPYYNTIFSAMSEVPKEMVFGENWSWLPEQWSKWEVLQERMERYGDELPQYEEPVIYYSDIELLHRSFLDLQDHWASFVVFRDVENPIVKKYLTEVGRRVPVSEGVYEEYYEGYQADTSRLVEQSHIDRAIECMVKKVDAPGSFLELWKTLGDYLGALLVLKRYEEAKIEFSPPPDEDASAYALGIWQNISIQGVEYPHKIIPWHMLKDLYQRVPGRKVIPWANAFNPSEVETVRMITDGSNEIDYADPGARINLTVSMDDKRLFEDKITLFPELYRKLLPQSERGNLITNLRGEWGPLEPGIERWPELVNRAITREARKIVGVDLEKINYLLLSVIGRTNGEAMMKMIDGYITGNRDYKTYSIFSSDKAWWTREYGEPLDAFKRVLATRDDLPEEMLDFPSMDALRNYLAQVAERW